MYYTTLGEMLEGRRSLDNRGVTLVGSGGQEKYIPYRLLYTLALKGLGFLQEQGMTHGEEMIIQVDDNEAFIIIFWACILGGIIPVPLSVGLHDDHKEKLFSVWKILKRPRFVTTGANLHALEAFASPLPLEDVCDAIRGGYIDADRLLEHESKGTVYKPKGQDIAFIQFSSGSTGNPKGVVLTHANLIANMNGIGKAAKYSDTDSMLSWMPLTHDMGLIGFHLNPILAAMDHYLIPTNVFIRRPSLWLDKLSEHSVSISCSPNFGYQYLLKHLRTPSSIIWDLSSVRLLFNGAEPISETLCRNFLSAMSGYGLKRHAMCPVYGLAEASLAVTISDPEREIVSVVLDRGRLDIGDPVTMATSSVEGSTFVNVGAPVNCCSVRIAGEEDRDLGEGFTGHVQIKGASVTAGYYNNAAQTALTVTSDGWTRTGDLGFMRNGELYITGRHKDIFFVNGRNYYAHDIEKMAEELEGIELNKIAVVGFHNEVTQKEETVAFILFRGEEQRFRSLSQSLKALINRRAGFEIDQVVQITHMPKTTSGKLQRYKLLEDYRKGLFHLDEPAPEQGQPLDLTGVSSPEEKIGLIWERVLGRRPGNDREKFFESGGTSLKAAEVAMLLEKEFEVEFPVGLLYQKPTVKELVAEISRLPVRKYDPIHAAGVRAAYPLSLAQARLYYIQAADRGSTAYNIPAALRIKGSIDMHKLEEAARRLIARHDVLRMSFDGRPVPQFMIHETAAFSLIRSQGDPTRLDQQLKDLLRPFDLSKAPLLRMHLLEMGSREFILLLDIHHIISDGLSVYLLLEELFDLYAGKEPEPPAIGFKDYSCWEREEWQEGRLSGGQSDETFWLSHLEGPLPLLEMPHDFQRPALFSSQGARLNFKLGKDLTRRLLKLAADHDCSLHVVLFTVYNILLSKYTGQDDLVVGIPVSGRRHPDIASMQGMFVNNLAIRTRIPANATALELLHAIRTTMKNALDRRDYPFGALIEALGEQRDMSRNPVFDTMFNYQDMGLFHFEKDDISVVPYFFDPGFSKFNLSLEVFYHDEELICGIEYATCIFKKDTIDGLAQHFLRICGRLIDEPARKIAGEWMLSDDEMQEYVHRFNDTAVDLPQDKTIYELFEEQVLKTPDAVAVEEPGRQLTYRELSEHAGSLAAQLRKDGLGPNVVAGVLMERSARLVIAILGILKTGGCFLPLDTDLPEQRIAYCLSDSRSRILLSDGQEENRPLVRFMDPGCVSGEAVLPGSTGTPDDLAYIIYTSGTTGQPKGVMIDGRSLVNYILWASKVYVRDGLGDFPLYTSISFDLTITSLFTPLITGNRILIYREGNGSVIEKVIADGKADIVKATPSHLRALLQQKTTAGPSIRLKRFIIGGEKLERQLAKDIYERYHGLVELFNEYGPTEATVGCMIHLFDPGDPSLSVPIGIPAANTRIYLLDRFLQPVGIGIHGEIYISGAGVAKGYLFRPELTAAGFIDDPFVPGLKMYKTGDIARRRSDGVIEYIGRRDHQVKINGHRIELAEIETNMMSMDGISGVVVSIRAGKSGKPMIASYYTGSKSLKDIVWRDFLTERLPHYMIPASYMWLEAFPLTKNGKIDHAALPDPAYTKEQYDDDPGDALQEIFVQVWQEVLGEDQVRVRDNFFELGGDSIKAFQVASRLLERGISVQVKDILTYHTIEHISLHAQKIHERHNYEQHVISGDKDLSPIEWWFFRQQFPVPGFYNQSVLLRLNRDVDDGMLGRVFDRIIEHHDGLRMNIDPVKERLFYNNDHLKKNFRIERHPAAALGKIKGIFDITRDLLIRAELIQDVSAGTYLLITAHHLVMDGISWRVLLADLFFLYTCYERGEDAALPPKSASLMEWREKLAEYANSSDAGRQAGDWRRLESMPFSIPVDLSIDDWREHDAHTVVRSLDREKTRLLLKEAHKPYKTNSYILLCTALALTLREWVNSDTLLIGMEGHGRHLDAIDVSRTVGWFTALYPLRLEMPASHFSLGRQIQAVKEQLFSVPDHGLGYGVYKYLHPAGGDTGQLQTDVRFNYLGQFGNEFDNELFSYVHQSSGNNSDPANQMTARLDINAMIMHDELILEIKYNRNAHKESTIIRLSDRFFYHLGAIIVHTMNEDEVHFSPSDFDMVNLDQGELDALFS